MRNIALSISLLALNLTIAAMASQTTNHSLSENSRQTFYRDEYEEILVKCRPTTVFEIGPHEYGDFEDLALNMWVHVEGIAIAPGQMRAHFVHFQPPDHHPPPPLNDAPMTWHVSGYISSINSEEQTFVVYRSCYQGSQQYIQVPEDIPIRRAELGHPLEDIPFDDLFHGMPVMINCILDEENNLVANIVIVSNDWQSGPEHNSNTTSLIYDVYGFIDEVIFAPEQGLTVTIETMTGDPNHHTYYLSTGPQGGRLNFPWGYLQIPPNAIPEPTTISVSGDFMFTWTLRNIYSFEPALEFIVPIEIELRYFNLGPKIDPDEVYLSFYNEETGEWETACHMEHHPENHSFNGYIEHFSRYSLSVNGIPLQVVVEEN